MQIEDGNRVFSQKTFEEEGSQRRVQGDNKVSGAGKSFSEALILASTNPQYEKRLFVVIP